MLLLYVLALVAVVVGRPVLQESIPGAAVGERWVVLVFWAFYLSFLKPPRARQPQRHAGMAEMTLEGDPGCAVHPAIRSQNDQHTPVVTSLGMTSCSLLILLLLSGRDSGLAQIEGFQAIGTSR